MDNILISIIVPAYNIEAYIGRCLDSILLQSHKMIEVIVVDDGSIDGTWKIIEQYAVKDPRIVAIHKENGGVSSARLVGLERSNGEYIGFVDGDDYVEPDMYEHLLYNALKYKADISHCGYKMVFPDGHIDLYYGTGKIEKQNKEKALLDLLSGEFIEPGLWNKLYHCLIIKDFMKSEIWDEDIRINEDLLMNYLIFKQANNSIYEDKTFYHYILRKSSAMTSEKQRYKITNPVKVMKLIKQDVVQNEKLYSVVYCRYLRALINVTMQSFWKEDANQAKLELKSEIFSKDFCLACTSLKLKLMVLVVVYMEPIYKLIRKLYDKFSGIQKKYDIN